VYKKEDASLIGTFGSPNRRLHRKKKYCRKRCVLNIFLQQYSINAVNVSYNMSLIFSLLTDIYTDLYSDRNLRRVSVGNLLSN